MSKKETGENPVRARRRKTYKIVAFLLSAAKRGQAIEEASLRRRGAVMSQSEYFLGK